MLIRIVKKWDFPDLMRQTPGHSGCWGDLQFTLDPVDRCDWLIVFNQLHEDLQVECPPENVWAVFQEPYEPKFLPWMKSGHSQFARVYTHRPPSGHPRYRSMHPMVPWHVGRDYDQLLQAQLDDKQDRVSWVTSNLQVLKGHQLRSRFLAFLQESGCNEFDVFGRGIRPVEDKWEALAPYRYSIAVENFSGPDYWTEKVADCWLAGALPFYYGCTNLEAYFPAESFVRIDIRDPQAAYRTMCQAVASGEYEKRIGAIEEARQIYLERQQFFPRISEEIQLCSSPVGEHQKLHLKPYRPGLFSRFRKWLPM